MECYLVGRGGAGGTHTPGEADTCSKEAVSNGTLLPRRMCPADNIS